jgi:uncharacterized protein with HEPN domain
MSEKDKGNLMAILDSCNKIRDFTLNFDDADAFYADEKTFDAVCGSHEFLNHRGTRC